MSDIPNTFHTLRQLLCPSNDHDTRVILPQVTPSTGDAGTSPFLLTGKRTRRDPNRLPSSAHLREELPSRMQEHLVAIIDQHYPDQAARTTVLDYSGDDVTPDHVIRDIRGRCRSHTLNLNHEPGATTITEVLLYQVKVIYRALTGNELDIQAQVRASQGKVITDHTLRLGGEIRVLWENKSSKAFDAFIGELMAEMSQGPVTIRTGSRTKYDGFKAILAKVCVCLCQTSPI